MNFKSFVENGQWGLSYRAEMYFFPPKLALKILMLPQIEILISALLWEECSVYASGGPEEKLLG